MRTARTLTAGLAVMLLTVIAALPAGALITPTPVKTVSNVDEWIPAASDDGGGNTYLMWSQNSAARPRHYDTFIQENADPPIRVSETGTMGFGGGLDGTSGIFQEVWNYTSPDYDSEIMLVDAATGTVSEPPAGVNNAYWQSSPTISGDWILYGENRFRRASSPWRIYLFNLVTLEKRLLTESTWKCACLHAVQVSGNYALWDRNGNIWLYDIAAETRSMVPNPSGAWMGGMGLTDDATVYYGRDPGDWCDAHPPKILRYDGGTSTLLYSFPDGKFNVGGYAYDTGAGTELYFDKSSCRTYYGDIFKLVGADTATGSPTLATREPDAPGAGRPLPPADAPPGA